MERLQAVQVDGGGIEIAIAGNPTAGVSTDCVLLAAVLVDQEGRIQRHLIFAAVALKERVVDAVSARAPRSSDQASKETPKRGPKFLVLG